VELNTSLFNPVQLNRSVEQGIEHHHNISVAGATGNVKRAGDIAAAMRRLSLDLEVSGEQ
jgi:outer membrane protein TolC